MALNLQYTHKAKYKAIFTKYLKFLDKLRQFEDWKTDKTVVAEEVNAFRAGLLEDLKSFRAETLAEFEQEQKTIETRYKNTRSKYPDPQAEILRRQDFDLEMAEWDANEALYQLKDDGREFSSYELAKIKAKFDFNHEVKSTVITLQDKKLRPHEQDDRWQSLNEQAAILQTTSGAELGLLYLPANNPAGYEVFDLSLRNYRFEPHEMAERINDIKNALSVTPDDLTSDRIELTSYGQVLKNQGLKYAEFDPIIFKGNKDYSVTDRHKYLQERLDDPNSTEWDFNNPGYDAYQHYLDLERRHAEKLENEPDYAERYYRAEKEAQTPNDKEEQANN
jgi:hypothetical protein